MHTHRRAAPSHSTAFPRDSAGEVAQCDGGTPARSPSSRSVNCWPSESRRSSSLCASSCCSSSSTRSRSATNSGADPLFRSNARMARNAKYPAPPSALKRKSGQISINKKGRNSGTRQWMKRNVQFPRLAWKRTTAAPSAHRAACRCQHPACGPPACRNTSDCYVQQPSASIRAPPAFGQAKPPPNAD